MDQVKYETFAAEVLGKGVAVIPEKGQVKAPCNAVVETVFDTKHAIGLKADNGAELLIHIGVNTVELGGKYYETHVSEGDHVKAGQLLITFDMDRIKAEGYDVTTPLIVTNTDEYQDIKVLKTGKTDYRDHVLELIKE